MTRELKGHKVRIWTQNRFFYAGLVTDENDDFIFLFDDKKQSEFMIKSETISQVEFIDKHEVAE